MMDLGENNDILLRIGRKNKIFVTSFSSCAFALFGFYFRFIKGEKLCAKVTKLLKSIDYPQNRTI